MAKVLDLIPSDGKLWEVYFREMTDLISDLERSWAAEWRKGCRKQEWELANASGGCGKSFGGQIAHLIMGAASIREALGGEQLGLFEELCRFF